MSIDSQSDRDYRFAMGLVAGTIVGAGLMMLFAPASGAEVRTRISGAIDDVAEKGQRIRDGVADAITRGAHEVEQFATAAMRTGSRQL